jgi:cell division protein FtsN
VLASAAFLIAGAHARHRAAMSAAHAHSGPGSQDTAPRAPAPDDTSANGSDATNAASAAHAQSASAGAPAPQYDFYRMLPSFKVPVAHDDERRAKASSASSSVASAAVPVPAGPAYLLQVGSYRSSAEADQIRARLARVGISARVQRIAAGSKTWNRVRIGPLSEAELAKVREQLHAANIHALMIRADR